MTKKDEEKKPVRESGEVEARPKHQGKDPLAGGERLYNESNESSAETYKADGSEAKRDEAASEAKADDEL